MDFLATLLDSAPVFKKTDTISNIAINSLLESELEGRFIEALRRAKYKDQPLQLKPHIVNGKPGWRLALGEHIWLIEPQVELGASHNVAIPARADFIFYPEKSGSSLPVAVFTDGFAFHAEGQNHRVGKDMAQRMALARSGRFHIWSLTWNDVEDVFSPMAEINIENLLNTNVDGLSKLLAARGLNWMLGFHEMRNFRLLLEFLARPDESWDRYAEVNALTFPLKALVDDVSATALRTAAMSNDTGLPVLNDTGGEFFAAWYERVDDQDNRLIQICTIAPKQSIQSGSIDNIEVSCRLLDGPPQDTNPRFKAAWGGFLRAFNIFQFLPRAFFVTSRGLESGEYLGFAEANGSSPVPQPHVQHSALVELMGITTPEVHVILKTVAENDLPLPEPGYELLGGSNEIIATAELAWPHKSIALLLEAEIPYEPAFTKENWKTLHLSEMLKNPEALISLLKLAKQGGE